MGEYFNVQKKMAAEFSVLLKGGTPWVFRLQGGKEFRLPLKISKVEPGGKAESGGLRVGDLITEINGTDAGVYEHKQAQAAIKKATYELALVLSRPSGQSGIKSVGITPTASSTSVSLTIANADQDVEPPSRSPRYSDTEQIPIVRSSKLSSERVSSPLIQAKVQSSPDLDLDRRLGQFPNSRKEPVPLQNGYHKNENEDYQRERSKTLPKKPKPSEIAKENNAGRERKKSTRSAGGAGFRAPDWYKQMHKDINTSMEGES